MGSFCSIRLTRKIISLPRPKRRVGGSQTLSPGQQFAQQLQSQLLNSFANQITQAIFGKDAQTSGNFSFGSTSVSFVRLPNNTIQVTINDGQTSTTVVVPASP